MSTDPTDRDILSTLAHWLGKHDCRAFLHDDDGFDEQGRAWELIEWFANSVDVLNVPPRTEASE